MKKQILFWLAFVTAALAAACAGSSKVTLKPANPALKHVVLISIDGFRPDFYLESRYEAPTLKALMAQGAHADSVVPVFPTLTYPNHTSIITGAYSNRHGVLSNTVFTWDGGPSPAWVWEAKNVHAPSLHDYVRKAGGTTASFRWPVTLGAQNIDYLVPEIFSMKGFYEGDNFALTAKYTGPALMKDILSSIALKRYDGEAQTDDWVAEAAAYVLKSRNPNFTAIHLANVDHVEHGHGRESPETSAAVVQADNNVRTILQGVDMKNTCVVITGDHGFMDVKQKIAPNILFVKKGWITLDDKGGLKDFKVIAHAGGGQAAIYLKDKSLLKAVKRVLAQNAHFGFVVIGKDKITNLGSYPDADLAIEGRPGFTISGSYKGELVSASGSLKGQHGYLPEHPEIHTGLIMTGCGFAPGTTWHEVQIVDIAPTIAKFMGLKETLFSGHEL